MTTFRKYFLISLIIAILNATILLVFFVPRFDHTDTKEYVATIKYLAGDPGGEVILYRILKPAPLLIGAALTPILDAKNTLVFQNLVFYFLSVWLIFLLVHRIYQNEKQAFYGTVLYTTAYPMLAYGLAPLTDLSGWFFYIFIIWLSLDFLNNLNIKKVFSIGLIAGLGMLFKENLGAAPIFFAGFIFLMVPISLKEKIKYISIFGIAFILPPLVSGIILYKLYSYSLIDWYLEAWCASGNGFFAYTPLRIFIEIGRVFALGWFFIILGILKEFYQKNTQRIKFLFSLIPSSLSFFLWSFPHNRIIYIAAPLLALLGSFGLLRNFEKQKVNTAVELILLFLYIFLNYLALEFFLRYGPILQPPGTLFG